MSRRADFSVFMWTGEGNWFSASDQISSEKGLISVNHCAFLNYYSSVEILTGMAQHKFLSLNQLFEMEK